MRVFYYSLIVALSGLMMAGCGEEIPVYKDPEQPVEKRVRDLIARMTIQEKMAQMVAANEEVRDSIFIGEDGTVDLTRMKPLLKDGIGQITRLSETKGGSSQTSSRLGRGLLPAEHAELSNLVQKFLLEETRLGIPAIFHEECLHGLVAEYATSTPQPIAMAGTFDRELVERVYTMIALETRVRGAHQALTPVVDVARDARWGRVEETYGEDTYLVTEMGIAAIRGFQGDGSFQGKEHIIGTLKHFAAHGQPEGGTNTAPANYSERVLREVHFRPFRDIIQKAGAISVMTTYHEIDGVPVNANKWLVTDLLRNEWGFEGFVVSDYYSIREMHERYGIGAHRVAADGKQAAELALKAGVNIELPNPDCYKHIPELVEEGTISGELIDKRVGEMLTQKFRMGLFDDPYVDPEVTAAICGSGAHGELALEAALKSITLLENREQAAPLKLDKIGSIAVIGPNADRVNLGGYSGRPPYFKTVLQGIRERTGDSVEVKYAEGCRITVGGGWAEDQVNWPDREGEMEKIREAVELAGHSDVIVLVVGGNEQTSREAWNSFHLGDRSGLELVGVQNELIDALHATGKPVIAFLFNGRPLEVSNLANKVSALFECWYLGQETGRAVASVLFGDYNPGGKLPISFPRSAGHIPVYYNHKPSARRGYLAEEITPLYCFGYGLSYTRFELGKLQLSKSQMSVDEECDVSVEITNVGEVEGDETLQLYIRDEISTVTRPVKELKDFKRVSLKPGETQTVVMKVTPEKLKFFNMDMKEVVEPGEFTIFVGTSSRDEDLEAIQLLVR
ncbi:MAG: glycoside hydrolase family 3 N-terminal domain-containing protein [Bacteroidales bacterium]